MVGQAGIRREGTCSDTPVCTVDVHCASGFPIWGNPAMRGGIPLSAFRPRRALMKNLVVIPTMNENPEGAAEYLANAMATQS
jgi:hypothetical protein